MGMSINNGTPILTYFPNDYLDYKTGLPFHIGYGGWTNSYWNGQVDELGFWKRVLTSSERAVLWNSGNGRTYPFGNRSIAFPRGLFFQTLLQSPGLR